jgi:hypothetical protein
MQVEVSAVRVLFELLGFLLRKLSAISRPLHHLHSDHPVHPLMWIVCPDSSLRFRLQLGASLGNHNLGEDHATQG